MFEQHSDIFLQIVVGIEDAVLLRSEGTDYTTWHI